MRKASHALRDRLCALMDKVHRSASQSVAQLHTWARLSGITLLCISVNVHAVPAVDALPSGGNISAGSGSISSQGNQMLINQASDKLAINWSSYNIGANASVTYQQPSRQSVALNRVFSADPSQLYGRLNANGSVILINPNGIVVGPGANINVGAMILSTLNLSDSDFLSNNYHFTTPSADSLSTLTPQVLTQGNINTSAGGYVHLIGHNIQNQGTISAPGGTVGLLAGDTVSLDLSSANSVLPTMSAAANSDARISQSGTINAAGGSVQLISYNERSSGTDINNNPIANTVVLDQSGTINASGGSIRLDGGVTGITQHRGLLNTANLNDIGGNITILGDKVGLLSGSQIDASGAQGGGTVLIGGNWQGQGPEHNASVVYMDSSASITANAQQQGNGGKVVLWSDDYTGFYGNISVQGGGQGGDGGQIEVSGKNRLAFAGTVNTAASNGQSGVLLLDPTSLTIVNGSVGTTGTQANWADNANVNNYTIAETTLEGLTGSVILHASGNITVDSLTDGVLDMSNAALTVNAGSMTTNAATEIRTSGSQIYNTPITLGGTLKVKSLVGGIGFLKTIDGPYGLDIDISNSGRAVFNATVGGVTPLASISTSATGQTYINADVYTTGMQSYQNPTFVGTVGVAQFVNGDFETGDLTGWTAFNQRVLLGTDNIAGFVSPTDTTFPATYNLNATFSGTFTTTVSNTAGDFFDGAYGVVLNSSGSCNPGFCIIRGPYLVSQGTVSLIPGDSVTLRWKAEGGVMLMMFTDI